MPYLKMQLQARAFEPKPRLVPPLYQTQQNITSVEVKKLAIPIGPRGGTSPYELESVLSSKNLLRALL